MWGKGNAFLAFCQKNEELRVKNEDFCEACKRLIDVSLGRCPNPLHFFPKELTFGKKQTSLLLLSLNRSFVLIQENEAKENQG